MSGKPVNHRETLATYLYCNCDLQKTTETLGINKPALRTRLSSLRKLGVKVPKAYQPGNPTNLEVAQMNSLVKKWEKERES